MEPVNSGPTPDFQSLQRYLNPAPVGIDAYHAWGFPGGKGGGIKIVDVERSARQDHEDFPSFFYYDGTATTGDHGTAVIGQLVGQDNGFGVTGIVSDAEIAFESTFLDSYEDAIQNGVMLAGTTGVVVLEIQVQGPTTVPCDPCSLSQCNYIPVEWNPAVFSVIENATALGTLVVEAGGNGGSDLDHLDYNGYFSQNSGAIIVGASESETRAPTCWSNYGSRIDLHAWGYDIVTTGYGFLFNGGTAQRRYTDCFGGTSGATPIVAGAATSLRAAALANGQGMLGPEAIRDVLVDTGTPQVPGARHIGPMPDLAEAFDEVIGPTPNQPPVALPDVIAMPSCSGFVTFDASKLLENDSDPDGDPLGPPCSYSQPAYGHLTLTLHGLRYTPNANLCIYGTDAFRYTIWDRLDCEGLSAQAWAVLAPALEGPKIFEDFFEFGDLAAWEGTYVPGAGSISATQAAALNAGFGLEVSLAGSAHAFAYFDFNQSGSFEPEKNTFQASFLLDPNSIALQRAGHVILSGVEAGVTTVFQLRFRHNGGNYQVRLDTWDDSGAFATTPAWVDLIDGKQRLAIEWRAANRPGANNGLIRLHLNNALAGETTGLDNDAAEVNRIRFGAVGASSLLNGSYYLDDFRSWR